MAEINSLSANEPAIQVQSPLVERRYGPEATITDVLYDIREERRSQTGYVTQFESEENSPIIVDISSRNTNTSSVTYDSRGRAIDANAPYKYDEKFRDYAYEINYTEVRESLSSMLNLYAETKEGDRVYLSSMVNASNGARRSDMPSNVNLPNISSSSSSGGINNNYQITGDLNEEESNEIQKLVSSSLKVLDASERFSKGEVSAEDLQKSIDELSYLKSNSKTLKVFSGSVEVEKGHDVIRGVETRIVDPRTPPKKVFSYETSNEDEETKKAKFDPRTSLERIIDSAILGAEFMLKISQNKEKEKDMLYMLRDNSIERVKNMFAYQEKQISAFVSTSESSITAA